jgi:uncharacterized protein
MKKDIQEKTAVLEKNLAGLDSLLVAFSGGVDSTLLLAVAGRVLKERVVAATFAAPFHSRRETRDAVRLAKVLGVRHRLLRFDVILPEQVAQNTRERCYHCKKFLGEKLREVAGELGIDTVAHGANLDDLDDFRPGFRAAVETGMVAPLLDAGFTKADIRELSREMGLSTWNKPALACLATRIPYDTPLTHDNLKKIEQAENAVLELGFSTCRVRMEEDTARIELEPHELDRMLETSCREKIVSRLRKMGFSHVALDLEGYRQGKMNRGL